MYARIINLFERIFIPCYGDEREFARFESTVREKIANLINKLIDFLKTGSFIIFQRLKRDC